MRNIARMRVSVCVADLTRYCYLKVSLVDANTQRVLAVGLTATAQRKPDRQVARYGLPRLTFPFVPPLPGLVFPSPPLTTSLTLLVCTGRGGGLVCRT